MTLIPSDAAGKAINRESIFELLPRHPLPSETVASWRNEYFNTCERISSRHHLLPPFFLIYISIYTHTHQLFPTDLTLKSTYRSLALSTPPQSRN